MISRKHLLGLLLLITGCGKVGDPLPPFIRIPEPVKDLSATQSGYSIILTWTNPARNIDGSAVDNLARVRILSETGPVATVNATGGGKPQSYAIPLPPGGNKQRAFSVILDTTQGKVSKISNTVSVMPGEVPGKVARIRGIVDQHHITLMWDKPQEHPELADAYIVTRTDIPGQSETVSDTRYEDTLYQPGKTATYQVTPVRRFSGSIATGIPSDLLNITVEDKSAPQVPAGLDIVQSDAGAYLTWDANTETDLAGYRVFKSDRPDSGFKPVGDRLIMTNAFLDPSYRPGQYYSVSAVDESNNESPMSAPFQGP